MGQPVLPLFSPRERDASDAERALSSAAPRAGTDPSRATPGTISASHHQRQSHISPAAAAGEQSSA